MAPVQIPPDVTKRLQSRPTLPDIQFILNKIIVRFASSPNHLYDQLQSHQVDIALRFIPRCSPSGNGRAKREPITNGEGDFKIAVDDDDGGGFDGITGISSPTLLGVCCLSRMDWVGEQSPPEGDSVARMEPGALKVISINAASFSAAARRSSAASFSARLGRAFL
jgi:hypothetical protein